MGLPYGKNFMILSSTVSVWYTRVTGLTDGQTEIRTDGRAITYSALSIYAICCRALKMAWSSVLYVSAAAGDVLVSIVYVDLGRCDTVAWPLRRVNDPHRNLGGSSVLRTGRGIWTNVWSFYECRTHVLVFRSRRIHSSQGYATAFLFAYFCASCFRRMLQRHYFSTPSIGLPVCSASRFC